MEKTREDEENRESSTGAVSEPTIRLRPVVYTSNRYRSGAPDKIRQQILLKAMQVTSDPQELRRMIGVRTVAEVYRTLDKLQMRRDYHRALDEHGVSFDFIVKNMKDVVLSAEKDADKINALKALLKSLGMDKYDGEADQGTNNWEESLLKAAEERKALAGDGGFVEGDYEVAPPEIPQNIKNMMENEQKFSKSLYED